MDVTTLTIPKEEAEEQFNAYKEALEIRRPKKYLKPKYLKQMKEMYKHLKKGRKILDIYTVFKKTGTKNGLPKLAIVRADKKEVVLNQRGGFGFEYRIKSQFGNWANIKYDVRLPKNTFPRLKKFKKGKQYRTKVPIVPAHLLPNDDLKNYYILWEVEDWKEITIPPKDPFLLKRINKNLFVIFAFWDLTPLERALIRGR